MKYVYRFARLPSTNWIRRQLNSASERLVSRLKTLDTRTLDISSYNQTYLKSYQNNLVSVMQKNTYILGHALESVRKPLSELTLIDYGGGPGLISMLAKELGVGTVVYSDINGDSCDAAKIVSQSIGCCCEHFVVGELQELLDYLRANQIQADAIVSSNVIEHIYDIESFFDELPLVGNGSLSVVMATRANEANKRIRERYRARQVRFERKGPNGTSTGYLAQREQIIRDASPDLNESEIKQLAIRTRGLRKPDIEAAVEHFSKTKKLPAEPEHSTNTCCPQTGNWAEHLMDPFEIAKPLERNGFQTSVHSGYYSTSSWSGLGDYARSIANCFIRVLNTSALPIAPFYTIYAVRSGAN